VRERERGKEGGREKEREGGRERVKASIDISRRSGPIFDDGGETLASANKSRLDYDDNGASAFIKVQLSRADAKSISNISLICLSDTKIR